MPGRAGCWSPSTSDEDELRLSVSDDGVGLPDDYEERGHGFANMRADTPGVWADALSSNPGERPGAPASTCVMPLVRGGKEG